MSYIYVMRNEHLPELVQIGMTDQTPEVHAQELSNATDGPGRFTVAQQWRLKNADRYTKRICGVLACYRVSEERYRMPVEAAIHRITKMLHSWGVVNDEGLTKEDAEAMRQASTLCAEQKRVEDERQRTIDAEVVRVEAEASRQFQRLQFMDKIRNVIVWCMTWALIESGVSVELTDHQLNPHWQYLVHLLGLIGLYLLFKEPFAKRDNAAHEARRRALYAHGLPAARTPSR
jgi:hypothetical protein